MPSRVGARRHESFWVRATRSRRAHQLEDESDAKVPVEFPGVEAIIDATRIIEEPVVLDDAVNERPRPDVVFHTRFEAAGKRVVHALAVDAAKIGADEWPRRTTRSEVPVVSDH